MEIEAPNEQEILKMLIEDMGFEKEQAELAVKNSPNKTLEGIIAFLEEMQNSECNKLSKESNPLPEKTESKPEEKKEEK